MSSLPIASVAPQNKESDSLISPDTANQPALNGRIKLSLYAIISSSIIMHIGWLIILIMCTFGILSFLDDLVKVHPNVEHGAKIWSTLLVVFLFVDTIYAIAFDILGMVTVYAEKSTLMFVYRGCAFLVMLISFALLASTGLWIYLVVGLIYLSIVCLMSLFIYPLYLSHRNQVRTGNRNQYGTSSELI